MRTQAPERVSRDQVLKVRTTTAGLAAVDTEAALESRTRSDMARILLAEAVAARQRRRV